MSNNRLYYLALSLIKGLNQHKLKTIVEEISDIEELFNISPQKLKDIGITNQNISKFFTKDSINKAKEIEKYLKKIDAKFISIKDKEYPKILRECEDAPIGLYIKSQSDISCIFENKINIAVVGTRDITNYGRQICKQIIEYLAKLKTKPTIVSGLALGTDIIAHQTSVQNQIPTIAVMATGIDDIYPTQHSWFANQIINNPCSALITEYPPNTAPLAFNFIQRNRIMAGLCQHTIVIESKIKGGSLCTARLANSYNRDVYAIPGRLIDPRSEGCNHLIEKNIAQVITDIPKFVESLGLGKISQKNNKNWDEIIKKKYAKMQEKDIDTCIKVLNLIKLHNEISCRDIIQNLNMNVEYINYILSLLESDGIIKIDLLQNCCLNNCI